MADINPILGNIEATAGTTERVLNVADPKKWLNLIMTFCLLLIFIIILIFLVKKVGGNVIGSFWSWITTPFRRVKQQINAIDETGMQPTITASKADLIANDLDNCFTFLSGDDEDSVMNILRTRINNAADWELVKESFGTRTCPSMSWPHKGTLEHVISHNFGSSDREKVRSILKSKGITTTI